MLMKIGKVEVVGEVYAGRRDAFFVPAVLVRSDDEVKPGDSVRFTNTNYNVVKISKREIRHGIVDPFLKEIKPDDLFWVLLESDKVGDLVHQFTLNTDLVPSPWRCHDDKSYER